MVSSSYNILFEDAKLFTKFDLKLGYHPIPIESLDIWKTTFKTMEFLFELLVIPFGLTNALEIIMGYIDDVIIPFSIKSMIRPLVTSLLTVLSMHVYHTITCTQIYEQDTKLSFVYREL